MQWSANETSMGPWFNPQCLASSFLLLPPSFQAHTLKSFTLEGEGVAVGVKRVRETKHTCVLQSSKMLEQLYTVTLF